MQRNCGVSGQIISALEIELTGCDSVDGMTNRISDVEDNELSARGNSGAVVKEVLKAEKTRVLSMSTSV